DFALSPVGREPRVELVELAPKQRLRREHRLVLGDESRRSGAGERVFDDLVVLGGAQQNADRRAFVRLPYISVEGFDVEAQLAEILWLELANLELERHEAREPAVEED